MELHCTTCATRFVVPDSAIGIKGRKVKCATCGAVWRQFPDGRMEHPAPAETPVATPGPAMPEPVKSEPVKSRPVKAAIDLPDPLADLDFPVHDDDPDHEVGAEPEKPSFGSLMIEDLPDPLDEAAAPDIDDLLGHESDLGDLFGERSPTPTVPVKKGPGPLVAILSFVIVLVVVIAGLYGLRNQIVERYPDTLAVYDLIGVPIDVLGAGLRFDADGTVGETLVVNGVPTLVVRGTYTNTSSRPREVPAIRLVVVDATDTVLQDAIVPPLQSTLAPHAKQGFHLKIDNVAAAAVRWKWFWAKMPTTAETRETTPSPATPSPATMTSAAPAISPAPAMNPTPATNPAPAMTQKPVTPKPLTVPDPVPASPTSTSSATKP